MSKQLRLLLIAAVSVMALSGCGNSNTPLPPTPPPTTPPTPPTPPPVPMVACASYTNSAGTTLTAMAARTIAAPNCIYETTFVDHGTPLTASLTLANLDADGVHLFSGGLVVGEGSATLADVSTTPVVLTIEAGATIAFANAANRLIVNRGAQIMAVGTATNPITFTSMADVEALASADTADDLAATATDQWAGITINGAALNNACTYDAPASGTRRPFTANAPFTLNATQPTLTTTTECSEGAAVFTAGATDADAATLADGFHGGTSPADDSGEMAFVIIKHVGDAAAPMNRNALHLSSVGSATRLGNIEVYSVDGSGIVMDGGGANLSNALVYNPQEQGVLVTGGYLGVLDGVLVSQAEGAGEACILAEGGAGGMSADEITDGMNTRVMARNLTCDVSADNAGGAGVIVLEGARARLQNAIIVGSRVAADTTNSNDNVCLDFNQSIASRAIIEVDGVIASCLEVSTFVSAASFLVADPPVGDRVIATDALATPTAEAVAMDIQFQGLSTSGATTISPLPATNTGLVVLSDAGTLEGRTLFSLPLSASRVNIALTTVVPSVATGAAARNYLGAIAEGAGNNPFFGWTFGVFTAIAPPPLPTVACASYRNSAGIALTAAARTREAPNCVYGTSFVDNETPLTASLTLTNLDVGGVHVFSGSLVVGADSATLAGVPQAPVVLTIEAGATIAFANAADRVIVNRGARIEAVGTAANPITFTSLADVEALASADTADDLAATATDQWAGITINGRAPNNACTYDVPASGGPRRSFEAGDPFTTSRPRPSFGATEDCSLGGPVLTADGFHGGTSRVDDSGELAFVIIKHVGDAAANTNRNALNLRSVSRRTRLSNIEVYSVDGSGIRIDGGSELNLSNILVYNAQEHGIHATGGFLGRFDGVLVSQADGVGNSCIQADSGVGGMSAEQITDGMNTRVRVQNLTCDVSADNAGGAGVVVTEGARARVENAIIVGSEVAADDTAANDNVCLRLVGDRSIIEADGVIASCLEASTVVTAANFLSTTSPADRVIAAGADAASPTADEVARDIQFHTPGAATTISPLPATDPGLALLYDVGTLESRALFSLPLSASRVDAANTTVVSSGTRAYLGAIAAGTGNNPFFGWTFGVFTATPPPPLPTVDCASYTNADGDTLTAIAVRTRADPNCVYETSFVDNETPLTASLTLVNLDAEGVHVFNGSLIVGADSATLADVPQAAAVLTIEAGVTIAFANAADRLIINRGAQISAIGTADDPITFTSLADVEALASADPADDLAATATDQWAGITINGRSLNNACTYAVRDADAATGIVPPRRPLEADNFTPSSIPSLTVEGECSLGGAVLTADGYYGGASSRESSGRLDFVIIKHVGDAATGVNRNALHLRSVGGGTDLRNIEVYSVDGTGIRIDGGFNTSGAVPYLANALIYNAQEHGIHATGGFLGRFDGVLVSQADGTGAACIQADSGAGGMTAAEITDGMNTRVRAQNLTCDVSADNAGGAGVVVTEGARALVENAIIVGSEVAADDTAAIDNVCLRLVGDRSIIEADGVIASCLEASTVVTAANFLSTTSPADRVIAANAATPTADEVAMDIQFHAPGAATTISPLAATDPELVLLSAAGTLETRALFSLPLSASRVDAALTTVAASGATVVTRTYLGAIAASTGNNPFFGWTFGVFTATPPPVTPPPAMVCASYTNTAGVELTAMAAPTTAAPNCVYEASFVDNDTPLTANLRLANLDAGGVHVFNGSLIVGAGNATLANVPATPVVLTIAAGTTIAFADAADRVIVNRGAQIEAVGTAADPITFTSLADVVALASADPADDLAADAVNQWGGISINGRSFNNACVYSDPGIGIARRSFTTNNPFRLTAHRDLAVGNCSEGTAVSTPGATAADPATLGDGFHGGTSPADDSGELAYVIIKHVGDAATGVNRNALNLRSVGEPTTLNNIEVYSVDGTGIVIDGGYDVSSGERDESSLSNILVYNAQEHGIHVTGGYLGLLDTVLVSQADGTGEACIQVDGGALGMTAAEIADGMNTRVRVWNLTCDVSANNAGGAGVIVTEGARARIQNAIIVGSRVAADATAANDNVCLELVGSRSIIEVDGVITSCLEASVSGALSVRISGNRSTFASNARFIPTTSASTALVLTDFQFHDPESATTVSPLAGTDTALILLSTAGTQETRPLFSLLLSASRVSDLSASVVVSGVTPTRTYLGAITTGDNPFSAWTFGVFVAP